LIQRLDLLKSLSEIDPSVPAIDEPTLKELDAAMLHNIEMFIPDEEATDVKTPTKPC